MLPSSSLGLRHAMAGLGLASLLPSSLTEWLVDLSSSLAVGRPSSSGRVNLFIRLLAGGENPKGSHSLLKPNLRNDIPVLVPYSVVAILEQSVSELV